jgi:predicted protein tyrosine phosphatase
MADRMITPRKTLLRNTLLARFAHAKAEADASNARVRQRSADRLETILKNPDLKRKLAGLKDRALTPLDRLQLEQAIAVMAPSARRLVSLRVRDRLQAILRHAIYRRRALMRFAVLACLLSGEILTSYVHTPVGRPVRLALAFDITWTLPDGSLRQEREEKGTRVILMRNPDGRLALRRWFDGVGYGELSVEKDFVRKQTYLSD